MKSLMSISLSNATNQLFNLLIFQFLLTENPIGPTPSPSAAFLSQIARLGKVAGHKPHGRGLTEG
jgi:hypothetical protein